MKPTIVISALAVVGAVLITVLGWEAATKAEKNAGSGRPSTLYALVHSPGQGWIEGVSPFEQPGIDAHIAWFEKQAEHGRLVLGGPFLDRPGGMMVLRVASAEEAERIATQDPGVLRGTLKVDVRTWMVPLGAGPTAD